MNIRQTLVCRWTQQTEVCWALGVSGWVLLSPLHLPSCLRRGGRLCGRGGEGRRRFAAGVVLYFALCLFGHNISAQTAAPSIWLETSARLKSQLSGDIEQKRSALFEIRNLQTARASFLAVPALKDSNEIVRATAASAVVFLPKTEAATLLMQLFSDKSEFVRKEAAYSLGEVGDDRAMLGEENYGATADALWRLLEKEKSAEVRSAVVIAMGKVGGLRSVERLYWYLTKSESKSEEFLRRSAVRSVGFVAETLRSRKRIIHYLERGITEEEFRTKDYSSEFRYFEAASKLFIKMLQDSTENDDVKREVAAALGNIGSKASVSALTANLNAVDPYLAQACKDALLKIRKLELPANPSESKN